MDDTFDILDAVEEDLGLGAAKRLIAEYGGQTIKIPRKVKGGRIAALIGHELAQWLSDEFAGMEVRIPVGHKYRIARVKSIVLADKISSANTLAKRLRPTARRIQKIQQEARRAARSG